MIEIIIMVVTIALISMAVVLFSSEKILMRGPSRTIPILLMWSLLMLILLKIIIDSIERYAEERAPFYIKSSGILNVSHYSESGSYYIQESDLYKYMEAVRLEYKTGPIFIKKGIPRRYKDFNFYYFEFEKLAQWQRVNPLRN